jgi:predicted transcriptional regulator
MITNETQASKANRERAFGLAADMLASKKHPKEVITRVCEKYNLTWVQAEDIVQEVQTRRKGAIARRQMPLKLFGAFVMLVIGGVVVLLNGNVLEDYGLPLLFAEQLEAIELPFDLAFYGGYSELQFFGGAALMALGLLSALFAILPTLRR